METNEASSAVVEMTLWESMTWKDFDILTQRIEVDLSKP